MLLKDVWHRGALTIIKKFKYLKQRGSRNGKFTFSGFQKQDKQQSLADVDPEYGENQILDYIKQINKAHSSDQNAINEGLEFDSMLTHLYNDLDMEELTDIRENSAYIAYVQLIGGYINYEEDGYDILAKEYKRELKYAGGNMMQLQLREIVDRSVQETVSFFTSIPDFEDFQE